jgi:hypothetical protein
MTIHRKPTIALAVAIAATFATLSIPSEAVTYRYRVSGTACVANSSSTTYDADDGLLTAGHSACAIPTGPNLVDISGTYGIAQVNMRLRNIGTGSQVLSAEIIAHDYDSASFCSCGTTSSTVSAGSYKLLSPTYSCGSCSTETSWTLNAHVNGDLVSINGTPAYTVKSMTVYSK